MSARRPARLAGTALSLSLIFAGAPAVAQESGPADRSGKAATHVEVTAGTDDSSASLTIALLDQPASRLRDGDGIQDWRYDQLSLTVSTPFDGEDAAPATLDGLADGTKATLRWGRFQGSTRFGLAPTAAAIVAEAKDICIDKATDRHAIAIEALGPAPSADARENVEARHREALTACDRPLNGSSGLVHDYLRDRYNEYLVAQVPGALLDWGIEGSIGYHKFDYVDPATLAPLDEEKIQAATKLFFAYYPSPLATAIIGSVGYELGYDAQDKVTLCPPASGPAPVACTTAAAGPPDRDESLLLSLGLKHRFYGRSGKLLNLAVSPLVTYDALDDVWGVDLPVYFFSDGKSGLNGGLRAGWRSDDKDVAFGIFIGSSFNIFN